MFLRQADTLDGFAPGEMQNDAAEREGVQKPLPDQELRPAEATLPPPSGGASDAAECDAMRPAGASSGASFEQADPDLARLVETWRERPHIRAALLALVDATAPRPSEGRGR